MYPKFNTSFHFIHLVFNDFFYFILLATPDENTLACFGKNIQEQFASLEFEYEDALNWFNKNKMTVNKGLGHNYK